MATAQILPFGRKIKTTAAPPRAMGSARPAPKIDGILDGLIPPHRRMQNTYRAMLEDTLDLLWRLDYANKNSRDAARIQGEAICELLTSTT